MANAVEGLVKLLRRMTSGGRLEAWLTLRACNSEHATQSMQLRACNSEHATRAAVHRKYHASKRPPDVHSLRHDVTSLREFRTASDERAGPGNEART